MPELEALLRADPQTPPETIGIELHRAGQPRALLETTGQRIRWSGKDLHNHPLKGQHHNQLQQPAWAHPVRPLLLGCCCLHRDHHQRGCGALAGKI